MNKTTQKWLIDEVRQLGFANEFQTTWWNGECTQIERVKLKRLVIALMEYLDIQYDGKRREMTKREYHEC